MSVYALQDTNGRVRVAHVVWQMLGKALKEMVLARIAQGWQLFHPVFSRERVLLNVLA
jgi:hypothetical protein